MSLEKQQAFIKMHFIKKKNKGTEKTKKKTGNIHKGKMDNLYRCTNVSG